MHVSIYLIPDCLVDDRVDVAKCMSCSQSVFDEYSNELEDTLNANNKKRNHDNNVTASNKKARMRRSTKRCLIVCRADDGSLREATFEDSA